MMTKRAGIPILLAKLRLDSMRVTLSFSVVARRSTQEQGGEGGVAAVFGDDVQGIERAAEASYSFCGLVRRAQAHVGRR